MPRRLSHADAVKLLGGTDSAVVTALDRVTGGLLLTLTGGGARFAAHLFDAKGERARLSGQLVTGLAGRLSGLGRYDDRHRRERLGIRLIAFGLLTLLSLLALACARAEPRARGRVDAPRINAGHS